MLTALFFASALIQKAAPFNLNWDGVGSLSGNCIVRVTGESQTRTLRPTDGEETRTVEAQTAKVVDALDLSPGADVTLLCNRDLIGELEVGKSYLVFGDASNGGMLRQPSGSWIRIDRWINWRADDPGCVLVVAAVEFKGARLERQGTRGESLTMSLASQVQDCSRATLRWICEVFRQSTYPGASPLGLSRPKTELGFPGKLLSYAEASGDPFVEAKVERLLNRWKFVGMADKFLASVLKCSDDTNAFGPDDNDFDSDLYWEDPIERGTPRNFEHSLPDANDWADRMVAARNARVRRYLLEQLGGLRPDERRERRLATLLASDDADVRCFVCQHFASSFSMPDKSPNRTNEYNGGKFVVRYKGLDEAVAYWKDRFRNSGPI